MYYIRIFVSTSVLLICWYFSCFLLFFQHFQHSYIYFFILVSFKYTQANTSMVLPNRNNCFVMVCIIRGIRAFYIDIFINGNIQHSSSIFSMEIVNL